jgi:anaerobic magnesium-protoporphyrin IX monomethyl ester cyclase
VLLKINPESPGMNSVLFTHSYFYKLDPKQWDFKQPYPPLGMLQAAAVVRDSGYDVSVFDVGLQDSAEVIEPILEKNHPRYLVIYDDGFNYLTKMCLTVMREAAFVMSSIAKRYGSTVIISSSDAADHYEKYFTNGVDYVVRGEGEGTLSELLSFLDQGKDPSSIAGLAFKKEGRPIVTPSRPVMRDLDVFPLPAWDLIDLKAYQSLWKKHQGYFSLNLATTRGCPYKCNWCAKPIYGNRYNSRSPEHVVREIELLMRNYEPDHFWMCDDIFGLKPNWVNQFNALVKERNLSFRYKIQSRADLLQDEETVQALAKSGCDTVWIGAESGSQKILDAMDKGITIDQIHRATKLLKQQDIKVAFFLQFGYSGETMQDIDATLNMVLHLMPDEIGISVSYPLPGTKFYDHVKSQLKEKQNWTDSNDLALMFQNTYPQAFYKILHQYVHSRYRIQRGVNLLKDFIHNPTWLYTKDLRRIASMIYHIPVSIHQSYQLRKHRSIHG